MSLENRKIAVFAQSRNVYERLVSKKARENMISINSIDDVRGRNWAHILCLGDWTYTNFKQKSDAYDEIYRINPNIKETKVEI